MPACHGDHKTVHCIILTDYYSFPEMNLDTELGYRIIVWIERNKRFVTFNKILHNAKLRSFN